MISYILACSVLAILFLANDIKCAIMGRWSVFKYSAFLGRTKVIAERKIGKSNLRVIRIPKDAVVPAPGWFRKGAA